MNKIITKNDGELRKLMFRWYMTGAIATDAFIAVIMLIAYLIAINI